MTLEADLRTEVANIFKYQWTEDKATVIPVPDDLRLNSNHAKAFEFATVLYADLDSSTNMVDQHVWQFAAEVYKAYLRCASQIIRSEDGTIAAYDGDRVMGVFIGEQKNTRAVRTALKTNFAVEEIIRPLLKAQYPQTSFLLKHVIGVDTSALHVARIGVHGDNDLVWVGRAANHAAKLCTLSARPIWITKAVYDAMQDVTKYARPGVSMWEAFTWDAMNKAPIYATTYRWGTS
jgi:class 3 adenylate cyclase